MRVGLLLLFIDFINFFEKKSFVERYRNILEFLSKYLWNYFLIIYMLKNLFFKLKVDLVVNCVDYLCFLK